jgi:hypothetical protein
VSHLQRALAHFVEVQVHEAGGEVVCAAELAEEAGGVVVLHRGENAQRRLDLRRGAHGGRQLAQLARDHLWVGARDDEVGAHLRLVVARDAVVA